MPVTDTHRLYRRYKEDWQLVRDCVEGSSAVKERADVGGSRSDRPDNLLSLPGTRYLPPPNPDDLSAENVNRYRAYRKRANYVNFTGHTKEGFLGMIYREEPQIELPPQVGYMDENATGGGLSINQLVRDVIGEAMETGRHGLLVDYPVAEEGLTAAQVRALRLQASILPYRAEAIKNWRCKVVNGVKKLSLVVLEEEIEDVNSDGFGSDSKCQYRVLRLTDSVYTTQVYHDDGLPKTPELAPRKADGSTWDEIPFIFVGSQNNDETPDKAILYDIAEINIAHYRNSADFEESAFMVGQPTPWAAGLTQDWVDKVMKGGLTIGSRTCVLLPEGGAFGLAQANPNQLPEQGMKDKEEQLVKVGANIIRDQSGNMRVDQVSMQFAGKTSKLALLVSNVEQAVTKCIEWALEFMGGVGQEVTFELNREFFDKTLDPQAVMAGIALVDRGIIGQDDMRDKLRKTGWIDPERTDEEIMGEAEMMDPLS